MPTLIENKGSIELYRGDSDQIIISIGGKNVTLPYFSFNYSFTWNPVFVDFILIRTRKMMAIYYFFGGVQTQENRMRTFDGKH